VGGDREGQQLYREQMQHRASALPAAAVGEQVDMLAKKKRWVAGCEDSSCP
jgi:hypothetical protein